MPSSRLSQPPARRARRTRRALAGVVAVLVLAVGGYLVAHRLAPVIGPVLTGSGCQATTARQTVLLDTQQAGIAATIAGVAHRQSMPASAVTVAYATAMQESKLHNLDYGDMDSVGVFQQRPSEGWGPRARLEDPVYAATKFFAALRGVHGYQRLPVYQAAQAVQHSADGSAYIQYEKMATEMASAFTGQSGHAVYCWWSSAVPKRVQRAAMTQELGATFGNRAAAAAGPAPRDVLLRVTRPRLGWAVAAWLVTHAGKYGIHQISYGGYAWRASHGTRGWVRERGVPSASLIRLS